MNLNNQLQTILKTLQKMTDFQAMEQVRPAINQIMREQKCNSTEALGELVLKVTGYDHETLAKLFSYVLAEAKVNRV